MLSSSYASMLSGWNRPSVHVHVQMGVRRKNMLSYSLRQGLAYLRRLLESQIMSPTPGALS